MSKKMQKEVDELNHFQYSNFCGVLNRVISVAKLTPENKQIYYRSLRKWNGDIYHDDFYYLSKLQEWGILTYKQIETTDDCLVISSLSKLEKTLDFIWNTWQTNEEAGWQHLQEEEHKRDLMEEQFEKAGWSDDFKWEGDTFIFGTLGVVDFSSDTRKKMFKALTEAKGDWVKVKTLEQLVGKDSKYVRPTLRQIYTRLDPKIRKQIKLISTENATSQETTPTQGSYKIIFTPTTE